MEKKLFASKRAQRLRVRVRETDLLMLLPFFVASKIKVNYGCKSNPHQMGGSGGNYVLRSLGVLSFCQLLKHGEQPKKQQNITLLFLSRNRFEIASHLGQGMPESFRSLGTEVASTTRSVSV